MEEKIFRKSLAGAKLLQSVYADAGHDYWKGYHLGLLRYRRLKNIDEMTRILLQKRLYAKNFGGPFNAHGVGLDLGRHGVAIGFALAVFNRELPQYESFADMYVV